MTEVEAVNAITQRFITAWDELNPIAEIGVVEYCFDESMSSKDYWARVTIRHSSSLQITTGAPGTRKHERRGTIFVQLFADLDQGRLQISKLIDATRAVFESRSLVAPGDPDPVTVYAGLAQSVETDGRWLFTVVQFPFVWYELR